MNINERLLEDSITLHEKVKREERQRRIQNKKQVSRLYYKVGELFCEFFPEILELTSGNNKEENAIALAPLKEFLNRVSSNQAIKQHLVRMIRKQKVNDKNTTKDECVSGQELIENGELSHVNQESKPSRQFIRAVAELCKRSNNPRHLS